MQIIFYWIKYKRPQRINLKMQLIDLRIIKFYSKFWKKLFYLE